jgi:hypothetical protein
MLRCLLVLLLSVVSVPAFGAPPPVGADARRDVAQKKKDKKTEEEKSEEEKKAEEEELRKKRELLARVIILKWPGTSAGYLDDTLRRNVRSRIARPESMFFPDVDLYQNGRKLPDRTVIPANQQAIVPDSNVPGVIAAVEKVAATPWNSLRPDEWGSKAEEMKNLSDSLWFVDRVELRESLFRLYIYTGYAAENANHPVPPFYESIGGMTVNYYYYLAAQLAYQEPALLSKVTDQEIAGTVTYYFDQFNRGTYPVVQLDFDLENTMEEDFEKLYEVMINGLPVTLDGNGRFATFLGRTDIYMQRKDTGHGLSERLDITRLEDKAYFVRETARKKMGIEFIDQLFLNPNACIPDLDGDILTYLAIYQKMHPKADVFVSVPHQGKVNDPYIWAWDKTAAQLKLISGGTDGFPVRFALVFSSGLLYNSAGVSIEDDPNGDLSPGNIARADRVNPAFEPATVPFHFELRGHWNRLMVNTGVEFGYNAGKSADGWVEYYQTPGNKPGKQDGDDIRTVRVGDCNEPEENADGEMVSNCEVGEEVLNQRDFNRYLYLGVGVVMGRDAGIGFGPRFAARFGWLNMSHGLQSTLHFGWAIQPPIGNFGGRFRPLVDLDLRGGAHFSTNRSLQIDLADDESLWEDDDHPERKISPVFGGNLGVGFTF